MVGLIRGKPSPPRILSLNKSFSDTISMTWLQSFYTKCNIHNHKRTQLPKLLANSTMTPQNLGPLNVYNIKK